MPVIHLITEVNAPIETVFDLSRNIDIHQFSAKQTHEKAIAGTTSGLIQLNDTVTFRGKHFGFYLKHKSKITAMQFPDFFTDEMEKGHFKSFRHEHIFKYQNGKTVMEDVLNYQTPYGIFGRWLNWLFLKKYLAHFLSTRNEAIRILAEKQAI